MTETDSATKAVEEADVQIVELHKQPVELYKILKFEGLVGSGGEAKAVIADGHVTVNDKIETQKRKKIVAGDTIQFSGMTIRMQLAANAISDAEKQVSKPASEKNTAKKSDKKKSAKKSVTKNKTTVKG